MDAKGRWALLFVLVVVGCSIAVVPIASTAPTVDAGHGGAAVQETPVEGGELEDADEIHVDVFIQPNGSATFTVDYRYAINDENRSDAEWEQLRTDVEENPDAYAAVEAASWNETLQEGVNETGRDEMEISSVTVDTDESTAPRELGHVEFTFEWAKFAYVEMNRIEAGDAISGFTIPEDTTLQFRWPDEYALHEDPDPTPDSVDDDSVFWDDEGTEFADDQPRLVLIEESATEPTETNDEGAVPWVAVIGALLLLAAVGAAGWWIRGERARTADGDGASPQAATGTDVADGSDQPDGPPPELLSNEERVLRLLEDRGGRIKQQEVVSELDWTEAKTSQVVSGLREDEEIEVFRIGRENVLSLPEEDESRPGAES